jgi:DNA-binding FrmR family transcriptional regulator
VAHLVEHKKKLLNRVRRLRGQIDALERALESDDGCNEVMALLSAARGAINGVMTEVVADHILMHVMSSDKKGARPDKESLDQLLDVLRTYIR